MERGHHPGVVRFFSASTPVAGSSIELGESAAQHARARRLEAGQAVRLSDGAGVLGDGTLERVGRSSLLVAVERVSSVPALPAVHLYVPVADRDRMLWLGEKAAELGATSWTPVRFARSRSVSPRGEGEGFDRRLRARMESALEQSGGAWLPEIHGPIDLTQAASSSREPRFLLDPTGFPLGGEPVRAGTTVMVGPEGGVEPAERDVLVSAGWRPARLGGNILRFETAGVACLAVLRSLLDSATN